ncbi:hypothetical protein [Methylophaga thiooxydans]|uniref:Uncharacterized protein n=1 Tax=Methylophaga thiooxydans DMS010 TaxID=637616 RepID=C0N6G7_9GAMM|nr:hypothetical protein [Methylophaga thiooxydans]EEF79182.1 hypothetical protein MDMS009_1769 [Methylophaga thiooxydans DMS010]
MTYPDDCLQSMVLPNNWWVKTDSTKLEKGALVFAFAPHVDQTPYTFEPTGRKDPTVHNSAVVKVSPLRVNQPLKSTDLPVAAMTLNDREVWSAHRAKKRPCIVFSSESVPVSNELIKGKSKHATAPTFLAAPCYGVDQGKRAGYSPEFVERVRHLEYPQFHWESLPINSKGTSESIVRLDHLQPFGTHYHAYAHSGYVLSEGAMELLDDQLYWLLNGGVEEDSIILDYRDLISETFE